MEKRKKKGNLKNDGRKRMKKEDNDEKKNQ